MIITISGTPGSGKSTVAKILAKNLGYEYVSIGRILRDKALERGVELIEMQHLAEQDPSLDKETDDYQKELAQSGKNLVVEGRTGFHFIPESFKVLIDADIKERAKRILQDARAVEKVHNPEEAIKEIQERQVSNETRYKKYYGFDYRDKKHYNLVIDSTSIDQEAVGGKILEVLKSKNFI